MSTIFITIPAYEDPLLMDTIEGALANAKYPDRLHFAIALIYNQNPPIESYTRNFNFVQYDPQTRPGVNLIRHELLSFYNNEDYFLMIDSHTMFAKNWDVDIINDHLKLRSIYGKKTIISKQVPPHVGPITLDETTVWELRSGWPGGFAGQLEARPKPYKQNPGYYLTNYASFHFFFAPGNFVKEVGITPINNLYCEEPLLSYQSFMHGWTIFARSDYHHIGHNDRPYNLSLYKVDMPDEKIWGMQNDSEEVLQDIDNLLLYNTGRYRIQTSRTPLDFYRSINLEKDFLKFKETAVPDSKPFL
jgi:hypothetical protein